jgi:hypothetical protein
MPPANVRAKTVLLVVLIGMLLMPVPVALANPIVTTHQFWMEFDYRTSEPTDLEGVQLIGWDPDRNQLVLLQQYGRCDSGACLGSSPSLRAVRDLECVEDRCVAVLGSYTDDRFREFQVVGQFSDRVRKSERFSGELMSRPRTVGWQIAVQDTALTVSVSDGGLQGPHAPYSSSFFRSFALALVIELLVATLALRGWLTLRGHNLLRGLGYALLANLISYPVTWIFWPSLGRFQPTVARQIGCFAVLVAAIFAALLLILSRKEGKVRRRWLMLTLFLLPLAGLAIFLCWEVASLSLAFGGREGIAVPGLPDSLTIGFAELFAVAFEALLLYLLARKTLPLSPQQAAVISLAMNVSSFLAGLALRTWL